MIAYVILIGATSPGVSDNPSIGSAVGNWVGVVGGIAGLVVLVAGLVVAAKGSYNKARITGLREDLDDSRKREEARRTQLEDLGHQMEVCTSKIEGLIRENVVLKDLVTQRVEIGSLQGLLETQRAEIHALKSTIETQSEQELERWQVLLREELANLAEKIEGLLRREEDNGNQ